VDNEIQGEERKACLAFFMFKTKKRETYFVSGPVIDGFALSLKRSAFSVEGPLLLLLKVFYGFSRRGYWS